MAGIVWLASYPKSGNTWVRVFLQSYQSQSGPIDINNLTIGHGAHHALFDRFGAVEVSELSDDEQGDLRPALYRAMASVNRETLFLKVHDTFLTRAGGVPLFPPDVTRGIIYILRNPFDLVVSLSGHFAVSIPDAAALICREDWTISTAGQCRQRLGSWSSHVTSWLDESSLPTCLVRYEDLLADPAAAFKSILARSGLPVEDERLASAIEHSSFEHMQAQERSAGFLERLPGATASFFRVGRPGDWRNHLNPDLVRQIIDVHGAVMQRFGYLTPAGEPAF